MSAFRQYSTSLLLDHQRIMAQLPPDAGIRGMYFKSIQKQLKMRGFQASDSTKRHAFKLYDRKEYLDIVVAAAKKLSPESMGQGLCNIGYQVYPTFRKSLVGSTIFAVADFDFERILSLAPRGFKASNVFGDVSLKEVGGQFAHLELKNVWNPIHLSVGIFVGAMKICGNIPTEIAFLEHETAHVELKLTWKNAAEASAS